MIIHGYNPDVLKADTSLESPFWLLMVICARRRLIFIIFATCFNNLVQNSSKFSSCFNKFQVLIHSVTYQWIKFEREDLKYTALFSIHSINGFQFLIYVNSKLVLVKPRSCLWFLFKLIVNPANSIFILDSQSVFQISFLKIAVFKIT